MRKLFWIGMVAVTMVLLGIAPVMASQTVGTPLYTDPDVDGRIRGAPLPRGFQFGRALPPSIDLEVEWQPIGGADFHRNIRGIFIDPDGTLRVVDIHPRAMRGMRVWISKNKGQNWQVEQETTNATRESITRMLGQEKADVVFHHRGSNLFKIWPLEVENLIKTEFRGLYEQRGKMRSSATTVFFAKKPNDLEIMAFVSVKGLGVPTGQPQNLVRIFVTIDGGKEWIEINPPRPNQSPLKSGTVNPGGIAIRKVNNTLELFLGMMGGGPRMVQTATLPLPKLERLARK